MKNKTLFSLVFFSLFVFSNLLRAETVSNPNFDVAWTPIIDNNPGTTCKTAIDITTLPSQRDTVNSKINGQIAFYKIEGDGKIHKFHFSLDRFYFQYKLLKGNCNKFIATSDISLNRGLLEFNAEIGATYYLRLETSGSTERIVAIQHEQHDSPLGDLCATASPIKINQINNVTNNEKTADFFTECISSLHGKSQWFEIIGTDQVFTLDFLESNIDEYVVSVTEGYCINQCTFKHSIDLNQKFPLNFFAEANKKYFIHIVQNDPYRVAEYSFIITADDAPINESCEDAILLEENHVYTENMNYVTIDQNICRNLSKRKGIWYKIYGAGKLVKVSPRSSPSGSNSIWIKEDNCSSYDCIISERNGRDYYFFANQDKTYYVFFPKINDNYEYSIQYQNIDYAPNSLCNKAIEIRCGDNFELNFERARKKDNELSLWYTFIGDGKIPNFDFEQNELGQNVRWELFLSCDSLLPIARSNHKRYTTTSGQQYILRVYSIFKKRLNSNFSFSCHEPAPNYICEGAEILSCEGETITIENGKYYSRQLPCDITEQSHAYYLIEGNDKIYSFSSTSFSIEYQLLSGDCSALNCEQESDNSDFSFFAEVNKTYYLVIKGLRLDNSESKITYTCKDPAPNDFYQTRQMLECSSSFKVDLRNASSVNTPICLHSSIQKTLWYGIQGNDQIYSFNVTNGRGINITTYEIINNQLTCLNHQFVSTYRAHKVFIPSGKEYIFSISSYSNENIEININLSCNAPRSGQAYINPSPLDCDTTIQFNKYSLGVYSYTYPYFSRQVQTWYSIQGDGNFKRIDITSTKTSILLYEFINDELIPLRSSSSRLEFYNSPNKQYYFSVRKLDDNATVTFELSCYEEPLVSNDICINSIPINCANIQSGSLNGALVDFESLTCAFEYHDGGVWFNFTGNDSTLNFNNLKYGTLYIYEGNCDNLVCSHTLSLPKINSFLTELGKEYKILFVPGLSTYQFETVCSTPLVNDYCENAIEITCGSIFEVDVTTATSQEGFAACSSFFPKSVWFKTIGDGNRMVINVPQGPESLNPIIRVFEGNCSTCESIYVHVSKTDSLNKYSFTSEKNKNYSILVGQGNQNIKGVFELTCEPTAPNATIENAQPINCRDSIFFEPELGRDNPKTCVASNEVRKGAWYTFKGDGNTLILSAEDQSFFRTIASVYIKVNDEPVCIDSGEIRSYAPIHKQLVFATVADQVYYIYLSNDISFNPRNIFVSCASSVENDNCEVAAELNIRNKLSANSGHNFINIFGATPSELTFPDCSIQDKRPDIWYKTIGNGQFVDLSFQTRSNLDLQLEIYTGNCGDFECYKVEQINIDQELFKNYYFKTEEGMSYFVRLVPLTEIRSNIILNAKHVAVAQNGSCKTAELISCNEMIIDSTDFVISKGGRLPCQTLVFDKAKWYKFRGDGDFHQLRSSTYNPYTFMLYSGDCDFIDCIEKYTFTYLSDGFVFPTLKDKTYYIAALNTLNDDQPFNFSIECLSQTCGPLDTLQIKGPNMICKSDQNPTSLYVETNQPYFFTWDPHHNLNVIGSERDSFITFTRKSNRHDDQFYLSLTYRDTCGRKLTTETLIQTPSNYACTLMNCDKENLNINNPLLQEFDPQNTYKVQSSIQSDAQVDQSTMYFHAGQEIILDPNFEISSGKLFEAVIEECVEDW